MHRRLLFGGYRLLRPALTLRDRRSSSIGPRQGAGPSGVVTIFHHAGGLLKYANLLCRGKTPVSTTLLFHADITYSPSGRGGAPQSPIGIDAPLRYSANIYNEQIISCINNMRSRDGGSQVGGLKSRLTRTQNQSARCSGKICDDSGPLPRGPHGRRE